MVTDADAGADDDDDALAKVDTDVSASPNYLYQSIIFSETTGTGKANNYLSE